VVGLPNLLLQSYSLSSSVMPDGSAARETNPTWRLLGELREISTLAGPIFVTIGCYVVVELAQVAQLGHYKTEALSASTIALAWTESLRAFLTAGAVGTLCSQAYGAGQYDLVGTWLQVALLVGLVIYVPVLLLCLFAGPLLRGMFGFSGELLQDAHAYSIVMSFAMLPQMIWERVTRYFQCIGVVIPETMVALLGMVLYLCLGEVLTFGLGSWIGLGLLGPPIACTIMTASNVAVFYLYACHIRRYHVKTWPGWQRLRFITRRRIRTYLRLYVPGVVQAASELWRMQLLNAWSGVLGETEAATQSAAFRIIYVVYVFVSSVSLASSTRMGQHLGAGQPWRARASAGLGASIAATFAGALGITIALGHRMFGHIFTRDEAVLHQLETISMYVALAQFFMTMADVFNPLLITQGRPAAAAVVSGLTSWLLHVPFCWFFAFHLQRGLVGLWQGILVGYIGQGTLSGAFVLCSNWPQLAKRAQELAEKKPALPVVEESDSLSLGVLHVSQ